MPMAAGRRVITMYNNNVTSMRLLEEPCILRIFRNCDDPNTARGNMGDGKDGAEVMA